MKINPIIKKKFQSLKIARFDKFIDKGWPKIKKGRAEPSWKAYSSSRIRAEQSRAQLRGITSILAAEINQVTF